MKYDPLEQRITALLDVYTLEEILERNDIDVPELLRRLILDGTITLPPVEPL